MHMATIPAISPDTSVQQLLSEVMPKFAQEQLTSNPKASELAGSTITMVVEAGDSVYNYTVTDGKDIHMAEGNNDGAMLKLKVSEDDMKKMIQSGNLDMILGIQNDLNKAKLNALSNLRGAFTAEIALDDGEVIKLNAVLNGSEQPHSVFKMNAKDTSALMRKEASPVNLFMSGAMKIDGDMAFAMATQPLFT